MGEYRGQEVFGGRKKKMLTVPFQSKSSHCVVFGESSEKKGEGGRKPRHIRNTERFIRLNYPINNIGPGDSLHRPPHSS